MIFTRNEQSLLKAVIHADGAEQAYDCGVQVCQNPVCRCGEIFLELSPKLMAEGDEALSTWVMGIDLMERSLIPHDRSDRELKLAREALPQMLDEDFILLWEEYLRHKYMSTQNADIDTIEAGFPVADIEQNGAMIGYAEVLPYADEFSIDIGGTHYYIADLHCVRQNCTCTESILLFYPKEADQPATNPAYSAGVDYKTHLWRKIEADESLGGNTARKALEEGCPNIYHDLEVRQRQLRRIYSNYLKAHPLRPVASGPKIGRNDPCPCGSGKKYKKCCGFSAS